MSLFTRRASEGTETLLGAAGEPDVVGVYSTGFPKKSRA